jgi:hypothetical protein
LAIYTPKNEITAGDFLNPDDALLSARDPSLLSVCRSTRVLVHYFLEDFSQKSNVSEFNLARRKKKHSATEKAISPTKQVPPKNRGPPHKARAPHGFRKNVMIR